MPDIFTKKKRSEVMSKIRSKGTKIELKMKNALEGAGIDFQYQPKLFGKPDFLIPPGVVVFCDSSFWHGRNWSKLRTQLKKEYWYNHIKRNKERDKIVTATLNKKGYRVIRFWDNLIEKEIEACITKVKEVTSELRRAPISGIKNESV
jgi:DNA mismatch endonuclease (patch repair protein)